MTAVEILHRKVFWYWFTAAFLAENIVLFPFFLLLNQKVKGSSLFWVSIVFSFVFFFAFSIASIAESLAKRNLWGALRIVRSGKRAILTSVWVLIVVVMVSNI